MGNFNSRESEEPEESDFAIEAFSNEAKEYRLRELEPAEEEEPFDFAQLPPDLQYNVVDRFCYKDFSVLNRTSRVGNAVCWGKPYSLKYNVESIFVHKKSIKYTKNYHWYEDFPIASWHVAAQSRAQIVANSIHIKSRVTSGRLQAVAKHFERNRTTASWLSLTEHITFQPEDLDRLLKAVKPTHFSSQQFVAGPFFEIEAMQNLTSVSLKSCDFTDDELLRFKCKSFYVENDFVTAKGLNQFLKQWKKTQRKIQNISIEFTTTIGQRNFEAILDGLEANPIWTPELHKHSLVGKIKLEEFEPMLNGDPDHMYSLCRSDDIKDTVFVLLSGERFTVMRMRDEAEYLFEYLDEDQHYLVVGKCYDCDEEFCEHRRRYSMPRLKMACPRLHYFILLGFKGMMYSFGALRIEKVVMGERPFTRPPLVDEDNMHQETNISSLLSYLRVLFFDHV